MLYKVRERRRWKAIGCCADLCWCETSAVGYQVNACEFEDSAEKYGRKGNDRQFDRIEEKEKRLSYIDDIEVPDDSESPLPRCCVAVRASAGLSGGGGSSSMATGPGANTTSFNVPRCPRKIITDDEIVTHRFWNCH